MMQRFIASPDAAACEIGDGMALIDLKSNTYFTLNSTGSLIWDALSEPVELSKLCELVSCAFDVGADDCRSDVVAVLAAFQEAGLVVDAATA